MPSKLNKLAKGELGTTFEAVDSAIFVDFTGVGSEETYALRKALHEQNITLRVVKNSLLRVALTELGREAGKDMYEGALGVAYNGDPVAVAKAIVEHRKNNRGTPLKVKGGMLEGKPIDAGQVNELANLPDRKALLGMVAGTIAAPLTSFIGVQAAIIRKLLYALEAIKEKREAA